MHCLGRELSKAIKKPENSLLLNWLITEGINKYRNENFLIYIDNEYLLAVIFPERPEFENVVRKEIELFAQKQRNTA